MISRVLVRLKGESTITTTRCIRQRTSSLPSRRHLSHHHHHFHRSKSLRLVLLSFPSSSVSTTTTTTITTGLTSNHSSTPLSSVRWNTTTTTPLPPSLTPRSELAVWYESRYGMQLKNSDPNLFVMQHVVHQGTPWWTCAFVCPKEGDLYPAGTIRHHPELLPPLRGNHETIVVPRAAATTTIMENTTVGTNEEEGSQKKKRKKKEELEDSEEGEVEEGLVYYRKLKTAYHAAAARKMDMVRFQEEGQMEPRWCEEDPSVPIDRNKALAGLSAIKSAESTTDGHSSDDNEISPASSSSSATKKEKHQSKQQQPSSQSAAAAETAQGDKAKSDIAAPTSVSGIIPNLAIAKKQSPKAALHDYYSIRLSNAKWNDDAYQTLLLRGTKKATWWSATFTCPETGRLYKAGSLMGAEKDGGDEGSENDRDEESSSKALPAEMRYHDGVPYYSKVKTALQAVAARAIDTLLYEAAGQTEPRLCHEDPSFPDVPFVHPDSKRLQLSVSSQQSLGVTYLEEKEEEESGVDEGEEISNSDGDDDNWEEEDYVLQEIPSHSAPLSRVVMAWSETLDANDRPHEDSINSFIPIMIWRLERDAKVHEEARSWYDTFAKLTSKEFGRNNNSDNKRRSFYPSFQYNIPKSTLVDKGKYILRALEPSLSRKQMLELGQQVFHLLRRSVPKLDIETYNAYLILLYVHKKRDDFNMAYQEFMEIWHKLLDDGNKGTPNANTETFNIVMGFHAFHGNLERCLETYNEMVVERSMKPNKQTFVSILQCIGLSGKLDVEQISHWIEQARDNGVEIDAELLHAPLMWGGKTIGMSNSFVYLGDLESRLKDGLLDEADPEDLQWVQDTEKWASDLEQQGALEKEGYRSIVEAWGQVGTRDGLAKAQSWATRAVEASKADWLTFAPVLSIMILSRDDPSKLKELMEQLEKWGESNPKLQLDGRAQNIYVRALVQHQKRLLEEMNFADARKVAEEAYEAQSQQCKTVIDYYTKLDQPPAFVDISSFFHTLYAYGALVGEESKSGELNARKQLVQDVWRAVSIFDDTIYRLGEIYNEHCKPIEGDGKSTFSRNELAELKYQLYHLMINCQYFYAEYLTILQSIDEQGDDSGQLHAVNEQLPETVALLRKSERFSHAVSEMTSESNVSLPFMALSNGQFKLPLEVTILSSGTKRMHHRVAQNLLMLKQPESFADKASIYLSYVVPMIMRDNLMGGKESLSKRGYSVLCDILKDLSVTDEKMYRASLQKKALEVIESTAKTHDTKIDMHRLRDFAESILKDEGSVASGKVLGASSSSRGARSGAGTRRRPGRVKAKTKAKAL